MKKWILIFLFIGLLSMPASIFGFTLVVTSSNETCAGNGSMTFIPSDTDPAGTISYLIYLLPNTTTPYTTTNATTLSGLSAGTYRVIAIETVGSVSTTQQTDVVISNSVVPLTFNVQSLNQACSTTSNIVVNTISGIGVTYEIFSGPLTFPLQASNTFSGLPIGSYGIRVFDACGNGVVSTFTVTLNLAGLTIGPPVLTNTAPPSCNFIVATNTITAATGTVIGYPLTIQYTVNPPGGGAPIIINTILNTGDQSSQSISTTIPSYVNQSYNYTISITDACGTNYSNNFNINQNIVLASNIIPINCNQNFFNLTATNFTPPFTLNFTSFPAGFNPATFNPNYPGPFNNVPVVFGSSANPTPLGVYNITITDACGRIGTRTMTIIDLPPIPSVTGTNNGCLTNTGQIVGFIPNYQIVTAIITNAPTSYPFPLPHNVTSFVDSSFVLTLNPVPLGDYTIEFTDNCGSIILPINVTVPIYVDRRLSSQLRPGCDLNKGSVGITSLNGKLTSLTITAAPSGFPFAIPYNGNANIITSGGFYMNNLEPGSYTFSGVDECNFTNTITVNVVGYTISSSSFSLQQNCGSFNIPLNYVSNGTVGESFWLQKLVNPTTNQWGHPSSNIIYIDGTIPNSANSFQLINNTNNLNISFNGTFRIVRNFYSYNNGNEVNNGTANSIDKSCIEYLSPTMTFNESLEIISANRISCSTTGSLDVLITANGTLPLHYTLVQRDGLPFFFDNGTNNLFVNLAPGIYVLQVEDSCGNIVNRQFDVSNLVSLVHINQPSDIVDCQTIITGNETFDITTVTPLILGSQSPANYTLTYYTSLINAQNGTNPIANLTNFNPVTNPQTIYARLIFNQLPSCYETTSFQLFVGQIPRLNLAPDYLNCSTAPVVVNASSGNPATTTYVWSDGTTGPIVTVSQIGVTNLTVTATNTYGTGQACTNTQDITVTISKLPEVDYIETTDWTDTENTITVFTSNNTAFDYSIDGVNFQESNVFTNLDSGLYTITVRDKLGCGIIQKEVWLLNYPKYFTPNGDGINETWYIKNQQLEPDFTVYIYDRYGKLIDNFKSNTLGWDGNYNGVQNVATDYWFVVYRQDGRVHKGHFTLKR